jgi:hypothetical protein
MDPRQVAFVAVLCGAAFFSGWGAARLTGFGSPNVDSPGSDAAGLGPSVTVSIALGAAPSAAAPREDAPAPQAAAVRGDNAPAPQAATVSEDNVPAQQVAAVRVQVAAVRADDVPLPQAAAPREDNVPAPQAAAPREDNVPAPQAAAPRDDNAPAPQAAAVQEDSKAPAAQAIVVHEDNIPVAGVAATDPEPGERTFVLASLPAGAAVVATAGWPRGLPLPETPAVQEMTASTPDPVAQAAKELALAIDRADECLVADICIDRYLWSLYERTPKLDTAKLVERHKVSVIKKGKKRTVTKTTTKYVDQNFTWKDPKAAERVGMSMPDYVIGGMDRSFKAKLYQAMRALDEAGLAPGITSAFRDDYRQSIATGLKAASDRSYHGGSLRGGYGHGMAADVVSVRGETRGQRSKSSEELWKWIDANGKNYGVGRPYLDRDPPHVTPIDGKEYADKRGGGRAKAQHATLKGKRKHHQVAAREVPAMSDRAKEAAPAKATSAAAAKPSAAAASHRVAAAKPSVKAARKRIAVAKPLVQPAAPRATAARSSVPATPVRATAAKPPVAATPAGARAATPPPAPAVQHRAAAARPPVAAAPTRARAATPPKVKSTEPQAKARPKTAAASISSQSIQ